MRILSTSIGSLGLASLLCVFGCKSSETAGDEGAGGSSASGAEGGAGGAGGAGCAAGGGSASGGAGGSGPVEPIALIDCAAAENDFKHPKCKPYPDAGTIGEGPPIFDASAQIDGAVLEGGSLIVAVDMLDDNDEFGGVMRVELATGKRTWLAGSYKYTDAGEVTAVGEGAEIGAARGITRLSDGKYIVYRSPDSDSEQGLFEVDLATGNRTDWMLAGANGYFTCGSLDNVNLGDDANLTAGTDGDFYVNGEGPTSCSIIHFTKDKKCEVISRSNGPAGTDVGTGDLFGEDVSALKFHDGKLYGVTGASSRELFAIDPANGNRTLLSSVYEMVGSGPKLGYRSIDFAAGKIYAVGSSSEVLPLTSVDPATGNRVDESEVPTSLAGPIELGLADFRPQIFFYGEQIVFETNSGAIGVYDPATGNSNWISL